MFEEGLPVVVGEHQVGEDEVDPATIETLHRLGGGVGKHRPIPEVEEDLLEERGNGRFLINAEDRSHSIGGVSRRIDVLDCGRVGGPWGGGLILSPK